MGVGAPVDRDRVPEPRGPDGFRDAPTCATRSTATRRRAGSMMAGATRGTRRGCGRDRTRFFLATSPPRRRDPPERPGTTYRAGRGDTLPPLVGLLRGWPP